MKYQESPIFRFLLLAASQLQLAEIELGFPILGLKSNSPLQFLVGCGPTTHLDLSLRQLVVGFGRAWVSLHGSAVGNHRFRIFALIEIVIAALEEFLSLRARVCVASGEKEKRRECKHRPESSKA